MKRYAATVRLEVDSDSRESLDYLLAMVVDRLGRKPAGVSFPDVGTARVRNATLSRVRVTGRRR